jgi:hypothetical protein
MKARTNDLAGIFVDPRKEEAGPPVGKPVQLELSSRFPEALEPAVAAVLAGLETMMGSRTSRTAGRCPASTGASTSIAPRRPSSASASRCSAMPCRW